ncbi:MAG: hypothetical protein IJ350_08945, partial [Clostridia bacterium]|nr:hypothetical protein [Clostridia bacterium]
VAVNGTQHAGFHLLHACASFFFEHTDKYTTLSASISTPTSAAGISRLRTRPKGFPIALWKPSAPNFTFSLVAFTPYPSRYSNFPQSLDFSGLFANFLGRSPCFFPWFPV